MRMSVSSAGGIRMVRVAALWLASPSRTRTSRRWAAEIRPYERSSRAEKMLADSTVWPVRIKATARLKAVPALGSASREAR